MNRRGFFRNLMILAGAVPFVTRAFIKALPVPIPPLPISPLLGFKGCQFLETGYVYAPYIPLVQTDVIVDPKFVKRWAAAKFRHDYYKKVIIKP